MTAKKRRKVKRKPKAATTNRTDSEFVIRSEAIRNISDGVRALLLELHYERENVAETIGPIIDAIAADLEEAARARKLARSLRH